MIPASSLDKYSGQTTKSGGHTIGQILKVSQLLQYSAITSNKTSNVGTCMAYLGMELNFRNNFRLKDRLDFKMAAILKIYKYFKSHIVRNYLRKMTSLITSQRHVKIGLLYSYFNEIVTCFAKIALFIKHHQTWFIYCQCPTHMLVFF